MSTEYMKTYREEHKEKIKEYNQSYYQKNRDKWLYLNEKVNCECGRQVNRNGLKRHMRNNIHKKYMDKKENQ